MQVHFTLNLSNISKIRVVLLLLELLYTTTVTAAATASIFFSYNIMRSLYSNNSNCRAMHACRGLSEVG